MRQHFGRAAEVQLMILVGLLGQIAIVQSRQNKRVYQLRGQFVSDKMANLAQTSQLVVADGCNLGDVLLHAQFRVKQNTEVADYCLGLNDIRANRHCIA